MQSKEDIPFEKTRVKQKTDQEKKTADLQSALATSDKSLIVGRCCSLARFSPLQPPGCLDPRQSQPASHALRFCVTPQPQGHALQATHGACHARSSGLGTGARKATSRGGSISTVPPAWRNMDHVALVLLFPPSFNSDVHVVHCQ